MIDKGTLKYLYFSPNREHQIDCFLPFLSEEYGVGGLRSIKLFLLNQEDKSLGALIETYFPLNASQTFELHWI